VTRFEALFGVEPGMGGLVPRYNITPGNALLCCRIASSGERELVTLHWGLIPRWAKDRRIAQSTINARADTVAEKPSFRSAFAHRRALVAADGFFEWRSEPGGKQPYYFALESGEPFAFAGLWESWTDPQTGETVPSCTIIVTDANTAVAPIHHRSPVIIAPTDYARWLAPDTGRARWLAPDTGRAALAALLAPYEAEPMTVTRVSRGVNSPANDDPGLLEPD
jgi:putative SOS response-associated peptidase YedK